MSLGRTAAIVFGSLAVACAITGAFVLVGLAAPTDVTAEFTANQSAVPVPTSSTITPIGDPPDELGAFPQFEEIAGSIGFVYEPSIPTGIEVVNSGVYVADFDNNGYEDLLAVGEKHPVLFRNIRGEYVPYRTFEHTRVKAAHFFDYDNDNDEDLLLAQYGGELLFYQNQDGTFVRANVGFDATVLNPSSIVAADFTGNGCLDVFISQNGLWSGTTPLTLAEAQRVAADHPDVRPDTNSGKPNLLYFGDCEAFTDVTREAGISGQQWSLTSSGADFTGDGYPDIHVGNDWSEDYLYVNNADGTFTKRGLGPSSDRNAMSSNAIDLNGDFHTDIFVTNIYYTANATRTERAPPLHRDAALPHGNNYFVNDGTGNFTDRAAHHGLDEGGWGWTASIGDFSNDGHLDIIHTTTDVYWVEPYSRLFGSLQAWEGTPESWQKLDSREFGLGQSNTYSIARVDYDNDGDLDLSIGTAPLGPTLREQAQPFKLYENQADNGESLQFFVSDPESIDRHAAVYIETDERVIYRSPGPRGNFQTQESRLIHVGTATEQIERVTVIWPDGAVAEFTGLEPGNRYILTQEGADLVP